MSDPYANVIVERKEIQMIVSLTNGSLVALHFDDRYYSGYCPECNEEVYARTASDVAEILEIHC
jgi:hypothetical protein